MSEDQKTVVESEPKRARRSPEAIQADHERSALRIKWRGARKALALLCQAAELVDQARKEAKDCRREEIERLQSCVADEASVLEDAIPEDAR